MRRITKAFKIKLIILLALIAFFVSLGRGLMLSISLFKTDLETVLSQGLGFQVSISSLHGDWYQFDPIVSLNNVTAGRQRNISIQHIQIRLDTLASIEALQPRLKTVAIYSPEFSLKQSVTGKWRIPGIEFPAGTGKEKLNGQVSNEQADEGEVATSGSVEQILDGAQISVFNLSANVIGGDGRVALWRVPNVSFAYQLGQLFGSGELLEPDGLQPLVRFSLRGRDIFSAEPVKAEVYVEARTGKKIDEYLKRYHWKGLNVNHADASSRVWLNFVGSELNSVMGDIQVTNLEWQNVDDSLPPVQNLAANFSWSKTGDGAQLYLNGLGFKWNGQTLKPTHIKLDQRSQYSEISIDRLDLAVISKLLIASHILPPDTENRLVINDIQGYLKHFHLWLNHSEKVTDGSETRNSPKSHFKLETELDNLSLNAFGGSPGGKGMDGFAEVDEQGGTVLVDSHRFQLNFPRLFLEPWSFEHAEVAVSWQNEGETTRVFSNGIRLYLNRDSLVYGDFESILNPDDEEDLLTLKIAMKNMDASQVRRFVPYYKVSEGLYRWIESSLKGGQISDGIYVGFGSTEDIDMASSFTNTMFFETDHFNIQFDPAWPAIEHLDSRIELQNGALRIEAEKADIAGTALHDLNLIMPEPAKGEDRMLHARTRVVPSMTQLDYWLTSSPFSESTSAVADQLDFNGGIGFDVNLDIPMSGDSETAYDIRTHFDNATIFHEDSGVTFRDVNGELAITSAKGLVANDITLRAFGQPALLNVTTRQSGDIDIDLSGKLDVMALEKEFNLPRIYGMEGRSDLHASLRLPHENNLPVSLKLDSSMKGISQKWPAPFNKPPEKSLPLQVDMQIMDGNKSVNIRALDNLKGVLEYSGAGFQLGEIMVGGDFPVRLNKKGLFVDAAIKQASVADWVDYFSRADFGATSNRNEKGGPQEEGLKNGLLKQIYFRVANLDAYGQPLKNSEIIALPQSNGWQLKIKAPAVEGTVRIPAGPESYPDINLKHLDVITSDSSTNAVNGEETKGGISPRDLSRISVDVEDLKIDARSYGHWSFSTLPQENGVVFDALKIEIGDALLDGRLNWQANSGSQTSILTADVNGKNIEKMLATLDWDELLSAKESESSLALVWPGSPTDFNKDTLSGSVDVKLKNGVIKKSSRTTGALKVFGVLNTDSLLRRLKLDFSDLYTRGVVFDTLSGKGSLDQGVLKLEQPLHIIGSSGDFSFTGSTDLKNETLDAMMVVELPVSQNVPLAALVLGAPQVGGAVWVLDKILGEPLSSLARSTYRVKGTWSNPKVNVKKMIDTPKVKLNAEKLESDQK